MLGLDPLDRKNNSFFSERKRGVEPQRSKYTNRDSMKKSFDKLNPFGLMLSQVVQKKTNKIFIAQLTRLILSCACVGARSLYVYATNCKSRIGFNIHAVKSKFAIIAFSRLDFCYSGSPKFWQAFCEIIVFRFLRNKSLLCSIYHRRRSCY